MDTPFLAFVAFGFLAQIVDGALGMAYGVSSTTLLLSIGIPPATASASVHAAEVFTTGVSGLSHWKVGNLDKQLILRLLPSGIAGGMSGALLLSFIPADTIKPFVSAYLFMMGIVILVKAIRYSAANCTGQKYLVPIGLVGGFLDAVGGGGWGPVVTTTLVARGNHPRYAIGSVNLVEFFVTISESIVFGLTIGLTHWTIILGLLLGGILAAPLAALVSKRLPTRVLMVLVGVLIILLSIRTILLTWR